MVSSEKNLRECFKKFLLAPASSRSAFREKHRHQPHLARGFLPAKDEAGGSPPLPPPRRRPHMFFCLRRKTRCWTWSSCLHEQSAQEHINESHTFVAPVSLDLNRLTWTSDTIFQRSSQPTMNKAPVQPPTACKAYPMQ